MGVEIRPATRDDVPGILAVYNEAVQNTTASYDLEPQSVDVRMAWFDDHLQNGYPVLVARDGSGDLLGWASLSRFKEKPGYKYTVENSVYVAERARGQGVGRALMVELIEVARLSGFHAIIAGLDADNEVSYKLHESLGFKEVGHLHQVGRKFDRWLDVIYMQLIL